MHFSKLDNSISEKGRSVHDGIAILCFFYGLSLLELAARKRSEDFYNQQTTVGFFLQCWEGSARYLLSLSSACLETCGRPVCRPGYLSVDVYIRSYCVS